MTDGGNGAAAVVRRVVGHNRILKRNRAAKIIDAAAQYGERVAADRAVRHRHNTAAEVCDTGSRS